MTVAYAVTNVFAGLAETAFTWSTGDTSNRSFLNDGAMDQRMSLSSSAGGINLVIDCGVGRSLSGVALLNHNLASAVVPIVTIKAADDAAITVNVITPKVASLITLTAPRHKDHVFQFAASASKRYWQVLITWTGSYQLSIGEVFGYATSTQLSRKASYGSGEGESFRLAQNDMQSGESRAVFISGPMRRLLLKWSDHNSTQRDELRTLWRAVKGPVTPFLYIPSYEAVSTSAANDEEEVIYGRLMQAAFDFTQPDHNLFNPPDLEIVSLGREMGS